MKLQNNIDFSETSYIYIYMCVCVCVCVCACVNACVCKKPDYQKLLFTKCKTVLEGEVYVGGEIVEL